MVMVFGALAFFWGCSSSSDDNIIPATGTSTGSGTGSEEVQVTAEEFLASQGLEIVDSVTIDGDTGYLAEYRGKVSTHEDGNGEPITHPKYCLVLTGKPSSMGYQTGWLRAEAAHAMLTRFLRVVGISQLNTFGISVDINSPEGEKIFDLLYDEIKTYGQESEKYIPGYLKEEMHGLVDGLNARGGYDDVSYEDVLALNQGVDSTYFLMSALLNKVPASGEYNWNIRAWELFIQMFALLNKEDDVNMDMLKKQEFPDLSNFDMPLFGCNEFVISGDITGGEVYHGRDFMFSTADIYQDAACMMVYLPDEERPFVGVSTPGFVGQAAGMNDKGVSIGMDISQGMGYGQVPGVGCLLVARKVLQEAITLYDAIEELRDTSRGVPWVYAIGDDELDNEYGYGAMLETVRSDDLDPAMENYQYLGLGYGLGAGFNGYNLLPVWEQGLFTLDILNLSDDLPDNGVMVRGQGWIFPEYFEGRDMDFVKSEENPERDPYGLYHQDLDVYFQSPGEDSWDMVTATNHNIIPRMRLSQLHPIVHLIYGNGQLAESMWRNHTMVENITKYKEDGIAFFGDDPDFPDEGSAAGIIDFLNPRWEENRWFYGDNLDRQVGGCHVIMNNTTKEIRGLFGYMADPWVGVDLEAFTNWYYQE